MLVKSTYVNYEQNASVFYYTWAEIRGRRTVDQVFDGHMCDVRDAADTHAHQHKATSITLQKKSGYFPAVPSCEDRRTSCHYR